MAAEPPLGVERREELVWLLVQAAELEHGLMCEYLFAQFTLKRSRDEGLSGEQLATVAAWEQVLIDVIKQEMLHLALTTNLLTAIGAAPPAPAELPHPVALVSAWGADRPGPVRGTSPAALHLPGTPRRDGPGRRRGLRRRRPGQPLTNGDELMAVPEDYQTVGHLYRGIEHGLERLVQRHGEDGVFIGPPNAQATTEVFEWPELTAVTDLASAKAAIELIVEQGEGARGDGATPTSASSSPCCRPTGRPERSTRLRAGPPGRAGLCAAPTRCRGRGGHHRRPHRPGRRPVQRGL